MARLFDDVQTEYLEIDQVIVAGQPVACACFFNNDDISGVGTLITIIDKDVDDNWRVLDIVSAQQEVRAHENAGGTNDDARSSTTYSVDTWHHACGIFVSATDRRVFLDGGSKGTNATNISPANLDRVSIGRLGRATPTNYMSGHIAEAAIWDLSGWPGANDVERADAFEKIVPSLAAGYSPLFYPLGLKAYWPLIRDANDRIGGYNLE